MELWFCVCPENGTSIQVHSVGTLQVRAEPKGAPHTSLSLFISYPCYTGDLRAFEQHVIGLQCTTEMLHVVFQKHWVEMLS